MSTLCTPYTPGEPVSRGQALGRVPRLVSKIKAASTWPLRVLRARRELEMLARMSENELKDIGLTRTDVGDATALPADASPTEFLAIRVEERIGRKAA